jgi:N-methylhydantoinase A
MRGQVRVRIGADIGGTFTDVVLEAAGTRYRIKKLTTHDAPEIALLEAVVALLDEAGCEPCDVGLIVHGTTLATNALIERRGATTALLTTEGFRDVLELGDESRFDQYDVTMQKPQPLIPRARRLCVPERIAADGEILVGLDEAAVQHAILAFRSQGVRSVAVAFLHSYANPVHEQRAAALLCEAAPDISVSLSSEVSPEMREYQRFSTTAANAYVQPLVDSYLGRLERMLREMGVNAPLFLMLSSGGITTVGTARRFPVRLVESGPAGGAIFAAGIGRRGGYDHLVAFDMGGTTAKLCLIDGGVPKTSQHFEVGRVHRFRRGSGLPLRIPVVEMVEIGAGGGSIARRDAVGRLAVGPHSAGSEPGPACYGRGGVKPTVTDADLLLGRIDPAQFAGGTLALDPALSARAMAQLADGAAPETLALGVSEIVDETMASAARVHAVEQGISIEGRTMIAFGGAAPLHAVRVAEKLGISRVVVPLDAGVGSAVGFLRAPIAYEVSRSLPQRLETLDIPAVNALLQAMAREAHAVVAQGAGDAPRALTATAFARFAGQGHEIAIALPGAVLQADDDARLAACFAENYSALYGAIVPRLPVEVLTWRVRVAAEAPGQEDRSPEMAPADAPPPPSATRRLIDPATAAASEVAVLQRHALRPGDRFVGPAVIVERDTTTVVSKRFDGVVDALGSLVLMLRAQGTC